MDVIFLAKLALSFVAGSVWVTTGTILAERHGTAVGGLVAGLPSTIFITLFFIGWTQSSRAAADATTLVPLVGGVNCLFILIYVALVPVSFRVALGGALGTWCLLSLVVARYGTHDFGVSLLVYAASFLGTSLVLHRGLHVRPLRARPAELSASTVGVRVLVGGLVTAGAVLVAKTSGPLVGGMFSVFPGMFLATMLITHASHGAGYSAAMLSASMRGGTTVIVYGVVARYAYVPLGLAWGTVAALAVSYGCGWALHWWEKA
jgi:hypothetical protein